MISFIIPTRNNLPYLKLAYGSIRKFYPDYEIIILDDNSTDGTQDWLKESVQNDPNLVMSIQLGRQVGHTVLYDAGVEMSRNEIFTIFHADMVCGPNYVENILKHLKPNGVVAATRIEPPLHPAGKEKIIQDFGTYPEDFINNENLFYGWVTLIQKDLENQNITTRGIFAPWAMYKSDFLSIGGHDKFFSPFPYEDSDLFQRMILKGFDIVQSRDAFVYHFTCRGHRWTEKVQQDDTFYKLCCAKNLNHYVRKWGSWIENDENSYPVIQKKYDVGFIITNCTPNLLAMIEPWCNTIYADIDVKPVIDILQPGTPFDVSKRLKTIGEEKTNQILVSFDLKQLTQQNFPILTNLAKIITDSGEIGKFDLDIFSFDIRGMSSFEQGLVNVTDEYYQNQLVPVKESDPYCTAELFKVYDNIKQK